MLEENAVFRPRSYKIDWKKIAALDFDSFSQNALDEVQGLLTNITFCDIEKEIKPDSCNINLIKLFKLAQYLLEYMMYCQNSMSQNLINVEKGIAKKDKNMIAQQKYYSVTKEKLNFAREEIKKLNKTLKTYKEILLLCSMNNWNVKDLIHQCPYCIKAFISDKYLISHIERRHGFKPNAKGTENYASDPLLEGLKARGDKLNRKSLTQSTPRKLDGDFANTNSAKHYVKRKPRHIRASLKEGFSSSESLLNENKGISKPIVDGGRQEAFSAFQSLCRSQEMKYLEEMKGFKDSLDTHMKEVADRIIGLVKDRITPTPCKKSTDHSSKSKPEEEVKAADEAVKSEDVVRRPIKFKTSSLPQVQLKEFKKIKTPVKQNRSKSIDSKKSADTVKQDSTEKHSADKERRKTIEEKNQHVQELEKSFEKRLQDQEIKWQQRLQMLEQRYNEKKVGENKVEPAAKKANNILKYPKVAKQPKENTTIQGTTVENKVDVDEEFKLTKPLKVSVSKSHLNTEKIPDTIPALLKKYAKTELPLNDATTALKVKIEKSLDKEMAKYGLNTSSHINKDHYDSIVENLGRKENSISQVYPNYVTIKKNVMDILENYSLHDRDHALKPSFHRDDVKYTIPVKPENNLEEESGSTFTLTPGSSRNSSDAENLPETAKTLERRTSGNNENKLTSSESSEEETPTRDVGSVPALIHPQPTPNQKFGAGDSIFESSESQVSYDSFLQEQQENRRNVAA